LVEGAHQRVEQDRHRDRERTVFGVEKHVPDIKRAGGEKNERHQARDRPADAPSGAPDRDQPDNSNEPSNEPSRFKQREGQEFRCHRGEQVKATAILVEIDPRQRAAIAEAGGIERQHQLAVFGVHVIVPAEAVVAKGCRHDRCRDDEQHKR
jgi:hypothetical protein